MSSCVWRGMRTRRVFVDAMSDSGGRRRQGWGAIILAPALLCALTAGCNGTQDADPLEATVSPEFVKSLNPRRIISFGPNLTETIFALGQGHRVIAVTSFCDYPPEIDGLPRIGGPMDPDKEKITMLKPDLVVLQGQIREVSDLARANGTPMFIVDMDSIDTIDAGIGALGEALDCVKEANAMRAQFRAELAAVRQAVQGRPRPKVFISTGRMSHDLNSLYTAGGPSFLSELVGTAGGDSIYADTETDYLEASKETIVVRAPDVVIEFHAGAKLTAEEQAAFIADWNGLPSLPAVRDGRVHLIIESYTMRPGPRVTLIARQLASLLHPEANVPAP
jgi:cobalamin transport system substrate-binding protein